MGLSRGKYWDVKPYPEMGAQQLSLWQHKLDEEHWYLNDLADFIYYATEHIAKEYIPIYHRIASAKQPEEIYDLTTYPRNVVRIAANQKIAMLQGRSPDRMDNLTPGYARWPIINWHAPRKPQ